jgi:hypothetical protein
MVTHLYNDFLRAGRLGVPTPVEVTDCTLLHIRQGRTWETTHPPAQWYRDTNSWMKRSVRGVDQPPPPGDEVENE